MLNKEIWEGFLNRKVVINCKTEEEAKRFMQICEENNLMWSDGKQPTKFNKWGFYEMDMCYSIGNKGILYSDRTYYKQHGHNIKTFEELVKTKFKGWEILKMIDEGELKENDIVIWHNRADSVREKCIIKCDGVIRIARLNEELRVSYLLSFVAQGYFTIEEKKYMTFDEARKTGKKFKHKDWSVFGIMTNVLINLSRLGYAKANRMLDEKAWEVEEDNGQENMDR